MAELKPRQHRAIVALLSGQSVRDAAKACNMGERTLTRWLADPAFREAYRVMSQQCLDDTLAQLQAVTKQAVATLRSALEAESESVRVWAAQVILDTAVRANG